MFVVVTGCAGSVDPLPGYTRASDGERASVMRTIEDYYARRERAALTGDTSVLFAAYTELADGEDRSKGINVDAFFVQRMRAIGILGLTHDIEANEPVGVYVSDSNAVAFVHGRYSWQNPHGPSTIGEFYTRIDLVRHVGGWLPVRTDEVELHERPPRTPRG